MNKELFFLDYNGIDSMVVKIKKNRVYIISESGTIECLEPDKLLTAIFWEMVSQKIVLIGDV